MRYLIIAAGLVAGYELIAAISRLSWGGNSIAEDGRLHRLRLFNQRGDVE